MILFVHHASKPIIFIPTNINNIFSSILVVLSVCHDMGHVMTMPLYKFTTAAAAAAAQPIPLPKY